MFQELCTLHSQLAVYYSQYYSCYERYGFIRVMFILGQVLEMKWEHYSWKWYHMKEIFMLSRKLHSFQMRMKFEMTISIPLPHSRVAFLPFTVQGKVDIFPIPEAGQNSDLSTSGLC